jgi:hypothetical protein
MMGSSQKMTESRQILQRTVKLAFVLVLVLTGMVLPALDVGASASWRGEYFANMTFAGMPVVRNDAAVNFDWGLGAPAPGIGPDYFSVRWTSSQHFSAGTYTFFVTADDGMRLWINNQLVIDRWHTHVPGIHSASKYLSTGFHSLRVEYFEYTGQASIRLWWQQAASPPPADAWRGEYYKNTGLNGTLALVRYDAHINFDWGHGAPAPGVSADHFAVRWTRDVHLPNSGHYTFYATVDDGVRLWVGSRLVIDQWYPQSRTTHAGTVYLAAGTYPVRVEYFEQTGTAVCIVSWRLGGAPAPVPTTQPPPSCPITPVLGFGRVYNTYTSVRNKLGCATEPEKGVWMAEEFFQGGSMYWRHDMERIYVLYRNGTWTSFPNTWTVGMPEFDPAIFAPPGYYQPIRGFGKVWREQGAVRTGLGWATTQERGFFGSVQPFTGGTMLWSNVRGILVLYNDGRWERFD